MHSDTEISAWIELIKYPSNNSIKVYLLKPSLKTTKKEFLFIGIILE